jgi:beta-phosphoglucomutase-like phosphatase (HAD superfamily)
VTSVVEAAPRTPRGRGYGAILLDMDGCLLDSNEAHARAWSETLRLFGHRVSASRLRAEIGKGGSEILRDLLSPAEHHFLADAMGAVQTERFLAWAATRGK